MLERWILRAEAAGVHARTFNCMRFEIDGHMLRANNNRSNAHRS